MKKTLLAFFVTAALATPLTHAQTTSDPSILRALLPGTPTEPVPGCALAVYQDGRLQSLVTDGYANLDNKTPLDGDTIFYAASISKQFTALAVVQLALQGKLDLDGDLRTWIPELPKYETTVTPRMLLTHSSGILDSLSLVRLSHGPGRAGSTSRADTLKLVLAQPNTNFTPGTSTTYSNGAYLLAALLIERTSGKSFAKYIQQHVLQPIGMQHSYMLDGEPLDSKHRAHGYAKQADGFEIRDTYPRYGGSGGLMLTLNDLAKYEYDIEHGHKVWTREVRALMEAPGKLSDGQPAGRADNPDGRTFALGLMVGQHNGRRIVEHGGGADAFRHLYSRMPEQKLAIATLCNRADSGATDKTHAAIDLILGVGDQAKDAQPVTGVYRADSLPVRYLVTRPTAKRLTLSLLPDGSDTPAEIIELQRDGDSQRYRLGELVVDGSEAGSLLFSNSRASGIRARLVKP